MCSPGGFRRGWLSRPTAGQSRKRLFHLPAGWSGYGRIHPCLGGNVAETLVGGTVVTVPRRRDRFARALPWLAVTPFAAWAAARVAGLERGSIPTQLMTATPYA